MKETQTVARHSNINTASLYANLADDELDKAYYETAVSGATDLYCEGVAAVSLIL